MANDLPEPLVVVWVTGFTCDMTWMRVPVAVVDGALVHTHGVTNSPGLYAVSMPGQRSRGSALQGSFGKDAAEIVGRIVPRRQDRAFSPQRAA